MISAIGAIGAGTVSYLLVDRKGLFKRFKQKTNETSYLPIEEAGVPEADQPENAKMVSEGSQFGVNYYNRVKEDK
nr:hypothetical protein [Aquibacillus saliphilus]